MQPSSTAPQSEPGAPERAIVPLASEHAAAAARLHVAGQPGTFLTSLGPDVLTVLYRALARSAAGFGFAAPAVAPSVTPPATSSASPHASIDGFISATTGVGSLFVEMGTRRLGELLPALLARYWQEPTLALRSVQTVLYPFLVADESDSPGKSAELLSIMVEPGARSRGIGTQLLAALVETCRQRHIARLDVTVDAQNRGARRFYERHGFTFHHEFVLYGRAMCAYRLRIGE